MLEPHEDDAPVARDGLLGYCSRPALAAKDHLLNNAISDSDGSGNGDDSDDYSDHRPEVRSESDEVSAAPSRHRKKPRQSDSARVA